MDIDLEQTKIDLIKDCIISDEHYIQNEDLYDKFFEETIERGLIILKTIDIDASYTSIYVKKIVSSAILHVLEQENRIEATTEKKEISKNKYSDVTINFDFEYQPRSSDVKAKKDVLQKIYDTVIISNTKDVEKQFLQIYNLRYLKKLSLSQISKKLNIPEEKISQYLFELMEEVRISLE